MRNSKFSILPAPPPDEDAEDFDLAEAEHAAIRDAQSLFKKARVIEHAVLHFDVLGPSTKGRTTKTNGEKRQRERERYKEGEKG